MRKVLIEDIGKIRCANRIMLNETETYAAYCVIEPDLKTNTYRKNVWLLDTATYEVRQLTYGNNDSWFLWDDSETLLLKRKGPDTKKDETDYYRIGIYGGEAYKAFTVPAAVDDLKKLADGRYLVKITDHIVPEEDDVHVAEEVPFWADGSGFVCGRRRHLYVYDEYSGSLRPVTAGNTDVGYYTISGGKAAFIAVTWQDVQPDTTGLYLYDDEENQVHTIVADDKVNIAQVTFCGNDLIYTASDMKRWGIGQLPDFRIWYADNDESVLFAKNSEEIAIGDTVYTDTIRTGGTMFKAAGRIVYFTGMKKNVTAVWSLDPYGNVRKMMEVPDGTVSCFDAGDSSFVFIAAESGKTQSVYAVDEQDTVTCVHELNAEYLEETEVSVPVYEPFDSEDGTQIDGWVLYPYGYEEGHRWPAVLEIHGGPRGAYGTVFYHEMQVMAARGYFVFYCNPHGSEGYGEAFADLRGKYGEIDYRDLMTFTDHILERYPMIDPDRVCVSGGSYGGFMCNWIEGHTDRFAAIASQRSVSNWVSDIGTSQIGLSFDMNEMACDPWRDAAEIWKRSPLKYADRAVTPILFLHSRGDYNCFIDQAAQMFAAMKYHKVPSRFVVFEQESHTLCRSGRIHLRMRRLKEILDWFDRYTEEETDPASTDETM